MKNKIKILKLQKGFLKDKILIEALDDCKKVFGSFFGDRMFYLEKNGRELIKVPKSFPYCEGEVIDFDNVCTCSTAWQFSWVWR